MVAKKCSSRGYSNLRPTNDVISTKESRSLEEHPGLSAYEMAVDQAIIQ
jgi:hypothetical protein